MKLNLSIKEKLPPQATVLRQPKESSPPATRSRKQLLNLKTVEVALPWARPGPESRRWLLKESSRTKSGSSSRLWVTSPSTWERWRLLTKALLSRTTASRNHLQRSQQSNLRHSSWGEHPLKLTQIRAWSVMPSSCRSNFNAFKISHISINSYPLKGSLSRRQNTPISIRDQGRLTAPIIRPMPIESHRPHQHLVVL